MRVAISSVLAAAALASGAHAENRANDFLLSTAADKQAAMLGRVVGAGCVGVKPFYMGIGTAGFAANKAFWSVLCADGRSFSVQVNPNGSGTVLQCGVLEAMGGGPCFSKLK